ncbi:RNA polymerase sigma factor [Actinomadura barringtoniae]|uniref:RNA polymerase sigma factor n=1 Tax=Actinomadura barringtoniae TaxID=1427535 RepID=A0A939PAT8_9ACTN|nr:RNA polymerase sigma factor [Actinomadura barringtoniae]MBO2449175.1 RNA polymerase sigma factor [Actinomadura barringtoniae]
MTHLADAPPPAAADNAADDGKRLIAASIRDPDRFTEVYDRYHAAVYRYVAGRLGPQPADDVTAETFLVAFRRRGRFDPERGELRPWLFGIATKLVAQHRRAETRRYQALARVGADRSDAGHEERVVTWVTAEGMQPQLARALAGLSAKERDVVLLVALGDLGHEEIAVALDIPYGTVGSRLNRARRKLRAALDTEGLD